MKTGRLVVSEWIRSERSFRSRTKGPFRPDPFTYHQPASLHSSPPSHESAPASATSDHSRFKPGQVTLPPNQHESQPYYPVADCLACWTSGPFPSTETHELGEELVASYLYQVHLYHWLESNDYGRFLV